MRGTNVLPGLLLLGVLGSLMACPAQPIDPDPTGGGGNIGGNTGGRDGGTADGGTQPDGGSGNGNTDGGTGGMDLRFKLVPTGQTYLGEVSQVSSGADTAAYNLANNGYAIAGGVWNSAGYTLLGVKPQSTPTT